MRLRFECSLLAVALFVGAGCSSDTQPRQSGSGANGAEPFMPSSGGSSGAASGGGSGSHAVSTNGGAPVVQIGGSAGRDVSAGAAGVESCASAHAEAELLPVYLAFAFDVSGSMGKGDKPWHDRTLKWDPVVAAIRGRPQLGVTGRGLRDRCSNPPWTSVERPIGRSSPPSCAVRRTSTSTTGS